MNGLNVFMNQFLDDILDLVLFGDDPVFPPKFLNYPLKAFTSF